MAKYPAPGRVKTRLARAVGIGRATALYRAFVLDLAERLRGGPVDVTWAYWPPGDPFEELLPGWRCRPQQGRDLGHRLIDAVATELLSGVPAVVVIGADAPHIPLSALTDALAALHAGIDVVLGPACDGGYYLIGMRALWPELFTDIPWSTETVLAVTLARARQLGLRTRILAETFDIDGPEDMDRLRLELRKGALVLPRTAALLGEDSGHSPP